MWNYIVGRVKQSAIILASRLSTSEMWAFLHWIVSVYLILVLDFTEKAVILLLIIVSDEVLFFFYYRVLNTLHILLTHFTDVNVLADYSCGCWLDLKLTSLSKDSMSWYISKNFNINFVIIRYILMNYYVVWWISVEVYH